MEVQHSNVLSIIGEREMLCLKAVCDPTAGCYYRKLGTANLSPLGTFYLFIYLFIVLLMCNVLTVRAWLVTICVNVHSLYKQHFAIIVRLAAGGEGSKTLTLEKRVVEFLLENDGLRHKPRCLA